MDGPAEVAAFDIGFLYSGQDSCTENNITLNIGDGSKRRCRLLGWFHRELEFRFSKMEAAMGLVD